MKTELTKIKDFRVCDKFIYYGAIFEVTSELRVWNRPGEEITDSPDNWGPRSCYGRSCKFIKPSEPVPTGYVLGGLIKGYDWMQGTIEVTYAKIIEKVTMDAIDDCYPQEYSGIEPI